ncbi:glycosyltransferase family 61 protein [Acidisoma sp.]|uniref:glycosyltransferase family 61 protein n=1 Tax=Acidisoma sp. TaxID=1872115 RepID=UPI003B00EDF7
MIFRPFDPALWLGDPKWGVYFTDGRLVDAASYRRLPRRDLVGQSDNIGLLGLPLPRINGSYIYGGPIIPHYGHFLTAALPRFWHILRDGPPDAPILCHSIEPPEEWFARPYVSAILGRLGLTASSFAHFREPVIISRLRVPRPAVEEQHFAHAVFGDLARAIGAPFADRDREAGPLYVSKTQLGTGSTYRLVNEQPLEAAFAARGIRIMYPERLTTPEQIALLASASTIVGTVGSAFHTTLFCGRPKRIIGLAYDKAINSNYALIDKLAGNQALYVHAPTSFSPAPTEGITFGHQTENPKVLADALLGLL